PGAVIATNFDNSAPLAKVTLKNTIVSGGTSAADVSGPGANFGDSGNNLIQNVGLRATTFVNSDILGVNPQLDVLRDNGGATFTHALLFGRPARDAGHNAATPASDQRGFTRVVAGDAHGLPTADR